MAKVMVGLNPFFIRSRFGTGAIFLLKKSEGYLGTFRNLVFSSP